MRLGTSGVSSYVQIPTTHQDAATSLANWPVTNSVKYKNQIVKTDREGNHPQIVEFYRYFQKELEKRGIPLYAITFLRTFEEQRRLYEQRPRVTKAPPGSSPHNWGCAVDIVHGTRFWDLTPKQWAVIGVIGKEVARKRKIPIVWGGDWDFYDPAHWELVHWRDLRSAHYDMGGRVEAPVFGDLQFDALEQWVKAQSKPARK